MNETLNEFAMRLAEDDISFETGKARLLAEAKTLIPSLGFMEAVDASIAAMDIFEQRLWAAGARRMRERNPIKGFRTHKLG